MDLEVVNQAREENLISRLDGLSVWPYPPLVLFSVGLAFLATAFNISNVAVGLPVYSKVLHIPSGQQALLITAGLIGYVVGSWANSSIADLFGRRLGLATALVLITVGSIIAAVSWNFAAIITGRSITGLGIGAAISAISVYIGELAPAALRGRYTATVSIFAMIGLVAVPFISLWLVPAFAWGWRGMFALGALGVLILPALPFIPESPRWLISKGRLVEAAQVIGAASARAGAGSEAVPVQVVAEQPIAGFPTATLLKPPYLFRVVVMFLVWCAIYAGNYAWVGLGTTFFVRHGFTLSHSIGFMAFGSVGYLVGAIASSIFGDMLQRKFLIQAALALSVACFVGIALIAAPALIHVCMFLLAASIGFSTPLLYTLCAESFPTSARATGVGLTDGGGHIGGACGPIAAMWIYLSLPEPAGFRAVFLCIALMNFIAICLLGFAVQANGKSLEVVTS